MPGLLPPHLRLGDGGFSFWPGSYQLADVGSTMGEPKPPLACSVSSQPLQDRQVALDLVVRDVAPVIAPLDELVLEKDFVEVVAEAAPQ